jgi:hypothetical protein
VMSTSVTSHRRDTAVRCKRLRSSANKGGSTTNLTERQVCETAMRDYAQFLRVIAAQVLEARLSKGARVLDASDLREWLIELAEKAEQAENLEQFLSQM